jgi:hypothetical protein
VIEVELIVRGSGEILPQPDRRSAGPVQ